MPAPRIVTCQVIAISFVEAFYVLMRYLHHEFVSESDRNEKRQTFWLLHNRFLHSMSLIFTESVILLIILSVLLLWYALWYTAIAYQAPNNWVAMLQLAKFPLADQAPNNWVAMLHLAKFPWVLSSVTWHDVQILIYTIDMLIYGFEW